MTKLYSRSLLALAICSGHTAINASPLEEVVVTAERVAMPLRQVGTSISVVNQEEITQLGFTSLYDVLRTQPGVAVTNTGGAGSAASLRIRGEEGYRTLVLLDGIDISDTSGPQVSPRFEQLLSPWSHGAKVSIAPIAGQKSAGFSRACRESPALFEPDRCRGSAARAR